MSEFDFKIKKSSESLARKQEGKTLFALHKFTKISLNENRQIKIHEQSLDV